MRSLLSELAHSTRLMLGPLHSALDPDTQTVCVL